MTLLAFIGVATALGAISAFALYRAKESAIFAYIVRTCSMALIITLFYGAVEADSLLEGVGFIVVASYIYDAVEKNLYKFFCDNRSEYAAVAA